MIGEVWDRLFQDSLKSGTRNNWVAGVRTTIFSNGKIINNQSIFLYYSNNESELFPFLSTQLLSGVPTNKIAVATNNGMVVSSHDIFLNGMYIVAQKKQMSICWNMHLMFPKILTKFLSKLLIVMSW